jgi:hypothetical protein
VGVSGWLAEASSTDDFAAPALGDEIEDLESFRQREWQWHVLGQERPRRGRKGCLPFGTKEVIVTVGHDVLGQARDGRSGLEHYEELRCRRLLW